MEAGELGSAERSLERGRKDMSTEREVKYERSSLLPTNILKTSPGSMPENELRSKIYGLYDSFFCGVYGLPSRMQVMSSCQGKFSVPRLVSKP